MAEPPPRPPEDDETVVVPPDRAVDDPGWTVPPERRVAVEETREEVVEPPPRRPPQLWPWLLALLLLVLGGLAAAYFLTRDDEDEAATTTTTVERVEVPLLVGLQEEPALERLSDAGLESEIERRESVEPEGVVLEQDPEQGEFVERGDEVQLVISEGGGETTGGTTTAAQPETARVPEVVGLRSSEASAQLREAGFDPRLVSVPSDEPAGTVVAQNPSAGTEAERGSSVRLNVSQPPQGTTPPATTAPTTTQAPPQPQPAAVPDVVGSELAEAAQSFADEGLKVAVRYVPSNEAQGRVVAQAQPPGTELREGDTVQVNVSNGAEPAPAATVPNVTGRPLADARSALDGAGYEVLAINLTDAVRNEDRVGSQTPGGGASVPRGSLVVLYVSR